MSTYNIEKIFDIPIYSCQINNLENVTHELNSCIDNIEFNMKEEWGQTHFLSDVNFQEDSIQKYKLSNLWNEINISLHLYCNEINFKITDYHMKSWFSLFKKNNYAHMHDHSGSDISGVYYHKTNGNDGDLVFVNTNPYTKMSRCFNNYSPSWTHKPSVGKLILFPSWLQHGVKTNETDYTRVSFSFNINFT